MNDPKGRHKALAKWLVKFALVAGLLYYLSKRGFLSLEATGQAFREMHLILPAFAALALSTLLGVLRWQVLLRAQGIELAWARVFELSFVGNFFNIALPGAISGDLIKAIYVGREIPGQRAPAFSSILFDRVAGVSGLVLLSTAALIASLGAPWGHSLLTAIQFFVGLSGVVVVVFYAYLFAVAADYDGLLLLFRRLEARFGSEGPFGGIRRIYEGLRQYRSRRRAVLSTLGISIVIHTLVVYACACFAWALGETGLPTLAIFVVVPLGLLVTAIPVMPAGVGTGHAAFLALFHLLGSQRGADIFTLFVFYQLVLGIFGGLVYLRFKGHHAPIATAGSGVAEA